MRRKFNKIFLIPKCPLLSTGKDRGRGGGEWEGENEEEGGGEMEGGGREEGAGELGRLGHWFYFYPN